MDFCLFKKKTVLSWIDINLVILVSILKFFQNKSPKSFLIIFENLNEFKKVGCKESISAKAESYFSSSLPSPACPHHINAPGLTGGSRMQQGAYHSCKPAPPQQCKPC